MEHRAGRHVDEGTLHAWLDGALAAGEAAAVEAHVAECASCAAAAAEARGLVAAASRILTGLDDVPAGVLPVGGEGAGAGAERRRGERGRRRRPLIGWPVRAAAAVLVVAAGSLLVLQRSGRLPAAATDRTFPVAPAPVPAPPPSTVVPKAVPAPSNEPAAPPSRAAAAPAPHTAPSPAAPLAAPAPPSPDSMAPSAASPGVTGGALARARVAAPSGVAGAPAAKAAESLDAAAREPKAAPRAALTDSLESADVGRRDVPSSETDAQARRAPRDAQVAARTKAPQSVVKGRVVSRASGQPVPSAQVSLADPPRAVLTTATGEYTIPVPDTMTRATVRVRALGYVPTTQNVTLSRDSTSHDIALAESRLQLGQIVVTGAAAARDTTAGGCYTSAMTFFPSPFTLDTTGGADTLPLRLSTADARRFPVAYWTRHGPDSVTLYVAADSTGPGVRIDAAVVAAGLDGHTVPPNDAISQSSPFTATRCRPAR
jgi:carboxypeptidase family protein/putative zinc finger protein